MAEIGALAVRIGADTSGLQRGLSQAQGRVQGFQRSVMPVIKTVAALGAAATGAAAAIFAFGRAGMNAVDEQAKLARQLDATIGGLRGLQLAGEDAGVATSTMNSAIERLNMTLGQASRGAGTAGEALDRLGLSAESLIRMDADERMAAIADRVQQLGLSGAETADVLRQMGIRQRELVNLMRDGGDAIRDARQEVEDYGLAIDAVDVAMIEQANDAFSRLSLVIESVRSQLAVEMAPIVLELAERFNTAAREAGGWGQVVTNASEGAVRSLAAVMDALHHIRVAIKQGDVAIANLELGMANFAQSAWASVGGFIDSWIQGLNQVIATMNRIPGIDVGEVGAFSETDFMGGIVEQADVARGRFNLLRMELNELQDSALPSAIVDDFFDSIEQRRQELADSLDSGNGALLGGLFGEDGEPGIGGINTEEATESIREHLAERLELLREGLMTERELERERLHERMEELADMREHELIGQQDHLELLEEAQREHAERMNAIDERENRERQRLAEQTARKEMQLRQDVANNAISLLNTLGSENRAFALASIALTKGLAIAQTLAHTQTASMLAFASQLVPGDPSSYARAAAAAGRVQTMGRINAALIAAQGLAQAGATMSGGSSGSGGGSGGGSTGAAGATAPQPVRENLVANLNITGQSFSRRQVVELIEQINELQDDGMAVRVRTS